jgi:hypothetical protein
MPLSWTLQAFDHAGNVIGQIDKHTGGPVQLHGTPDAFASCMPDIAALPAFFTDPEPLAAALYEEYCRQYGFTGGSTPGTWAALKANKACCHLAQRWFAIAARCRKPHQN